MGLRRYAVGVLAAALTATVAIGGASSASAEPAFTIDACDRSPLHEIVYLVPAGVTVRFDTSVCTFEQEWTETNPFDFNTIPVGDYYDATLATAGSWLQLRDGGDEFVLYPCGASTADGSRLPLWNSSEYPGDTGFADIWDPAFAAAISRCGLGSAAAPPSWYQSYARTTDADCEAGWSASWAAWPNGGTGGAVCNREIFFDTATGTWSSR